MMGEISYIMVGASFEERCAKAKDILSLCLRESEKIAERELDLLQNNYKKISNDNSVLSKILGDIHKESSQVVVNNSQETMRILWLFSQDVCLMICGADATAFAMKAIEHERRTR